MFKEAKRRNRVFQELLLRICDQRPPVYDSGPDIILWKHAQDDYQKTFSTRATWEQVRVKREKVDWSDVVWFKQAVPQFSFITWLAIKNRLSTGDHMRMWGVQQDCMLCGEKNETRDHLFFACPYSYMVWVTVTGALLGTLITPDWTDTMERLQRDRVATMNKVLAKMAFQTTIYHIWRERNAWRHGKTWIQMAQLAHQIDKTMRSIIFSLIYRFGSRLEGLMRRWFEVTT